MPQYSSQNELHRWCPTLRVVKMHGGAAERAKLVKTQLADADTFDVVVTTYEMLVSDSMFFTNKFHWRYVIVDEAQRIKNRQTQVATVLRQCHFHAPLLLTGTPLQNK
jgi:SWI/SNF-related matrix-associated actin-dependent regulator of chromatin subfamily A member 5